MQKSTSIADTSADIIVKGARVHNLKNITVKIPHGKFTVVTGPSGSGKSSLAFDTIHAEGQRRYIETFSTYARQFLEQLEKPDVDELKGLSPSIAILQKTTSYNPRSTVGTVTEVYDHFRLLFSRISSASCPQCGKPIESMSVQQIVDQVLSFPAGTKLTIFSPIAREKKGEFQKELQGLLQKGYTKARIDGEVRDLSDRIRLEKNYKHNIDVIIDRVVLKLNDEQITSRLFDSISLGLSLSKGMLILSGQVSDQNNVTEKWVSQNFACPSCEIYLPSPEPRVFSFNSPLGACKACDGLGIINDQSDEDVEIDDSNDSSAESAAIHFKKPCPSCLGLRLSPESLSFRVGKMNIAQVCNLPIDQIDSYLKSIQLDSRQLKIASQLISEIHERVSFLVRVGVGYLSLHRPLYSLSGGETQRIRLASQLGSSLVGITYILDEPSIGLHPRDNQLLITSLKRLRDLGNTVIVVEHDEETMNACDHLIDIGPGAGVHGGSVVAFGTPNEVIQSKTSITAQYLNKTLKVHHQSKRRPINEKLVLKLEEVSLHNLNQVSLKLPLGVLNCITGVSGSGKSSLIIDTLYPLLMNAFYRSEIPPMTAKITSGIQHLDKVIQIDQSPIGRSPRSNPATYTGMFGAIRTLFSQLPDSQIRSFKPGRFSFNVKGGRCDECEGDGLKRISMNFMADAYITCETCKGARYKADTLQVLFKGKNIAEVLALSVEEALDFFKAIPAIFEKLQVLNDVGLGYLKLGQSATTLSGGEAQRIKLSKELSKRSTGKTLYILDEPSTGLHFEDIKKLLSILNRLVDQGNTVCVIEHNVDIICSADHVIDLGPEGGEQGGKIVIEGTPEQISKSKISRLAPFLINALK
jgi:excinuclease ABC subunit A